MLTTNTTFNQLAQGYVRPLTWKLRFAFDKQFDDSVSFFTLDTSVLDGPDILSSLDSNVVAEWDKYTYEDYSDRVISVEWQSEEQIPYSFSQTFADITLNNYDNYFTRGSGSPIDPYLLPKRPVRILAGFGGQNLPQFVGLTTNVPTIDKTRRTATVHCVDFLSYLFDRTLDETVSMVDFRTDEVLAVILLQFGLSEDQFDLEEGHNIISYVYFEKGKKFGDAAKELMEAELGSLYMNEQGIIVFRNRLHPVTSPVFTFNESNIVEYNVSDESKIINVAEIKASVRAVQPTQTIYTLLAPLKLTEDAAHEFFFNFDDPVTEIESITNYTANVKEDGTGSDITGVVDVTDVDLFNNAAKVTFDNTTGEVGYITSLSILGTPAKIIRNIYYKAFDQGSIDEFEEQPYTIENNFIQSNSAAESVGLSLVNYYKDYGNTIEMTVKGNYALQLGDMISVEVDDITDNYVITKKVNVLSNGKFTQRLSGKVYNVPDYFILDQSLLDGPQVLSI